jgi:hypothetical protein
MACRPSATRSLMMTPFTLLFATLPFEGFTS